MILNLLICGGYHSICKTYNDKFYSWGDNAYGQLGLEGNHESNVINLFNVIIGLIILLILEIVVIKSFFIIN